MIKEKLRSKIITALNDALAQGKLGQLLSVSQEVTIDEPHKASHGDYCSQIALRLAADAGLSAMQIAQVICTNIADKSKSTFQITPAEPGFLNIELGQDWLSQSLCDLFQKLDPLKTTDILSFDEETRTAMAPDFVRIQNAEATARAILKNALESRVNLLAERIEPPYISTEEWESLNVSYKSSPGAFMPLFDNQSQIVAYQKLLILHMDEFLAASAQPRSNLYLIEKLSRIADDFSQFCKLATFSQRDRNTTSAMLGLALACQKLLASARQLPQY